MNLSLLAALVSTALFGTLAIIFSRREEQAKKALVSLESKQKQRIYHLSILKEIQEKIGYELNVKKVIEVLIASLETFLHYTTVSFLIIKDNKLLFEIHCTEPIHHAFVERVKNSMVVSLSTLLGKPLPMGLEENLQHVAFSSNGPQAPASFFNIPLIVNESVVGIINIASSKPGLFSEDDMTLLYQITNQASLALSKLNDILKTEKGMLLSMIGSLQDGLLMIDRHNRVQVINQAAQTLLGIQHANLNLFDIASMLPKDYDISVDVYRCMKNQQYVKKNVQIKDKLLTLTIIPVTKMHPIGNYPLKGEEAVIGATILLHDATLEKNLIKLKEGFSHKLVHDIQAPLTAIQGASSLLLNTKDTLTQEEATQMTKIVSEQTKTLMKRMLRFIDFARVSTGIMMLQKTNEDINKLLQESLQAVSALAKEKKITIETDIAEHLPLIPLDKKRVQEVLEKFLQNAVRYSTQESSVAVKIEKEPHDITITISDTGKGIAHDALNGFFLHPSATSGNADLDKVISMGKGLSFYIAQGIIEAHGGELSVKSEEGKGTTILFTLPLS